MNDNWHYTAMLQNVQKFDGQNESGDSDTEFQRAYLEGNIGAVNLTAGRYNAFFSDGNVFDDRADAIEGRVNFGQGYFDAAWGKLANDVNYGWTKKKIRTSLQLIPSMPSYWVERPGICMGKPPI